jgi:glycosyltransferase involved in cell wall biosynthesis
MKNSSHPKIIVLPSFYPMNFHYTRGGFFEEQTRLIKNRGANVSVIFNEDRSITSFNLKKLKHVYFQKQFKLEEGLPVLRKLNWNIIPTKFNLGRRIWIKNSINLVESYIKQYGKPDLFHVHCAFNAGYIAKYLKEKHNIPYIITEHSTFFALSSISIVQKKEVLDIYSNAEKVIVVSNPFRKLLSGKTGFDIDKIDVVPNFIDTDYFDPNFKNDLNLLEDMKTIFTVCHHGYKKRLDRLLDAYKIVLEHYPEWKLIIGGNGTETNSLKIKTKELNLQNSVDFVGFLAKEQVKNYMKKASMFVLPSDVETFGVVVIEALAMGLPVVATASGGPEDIITKETGIIVERDTQSLAKGIIEIITNYSTYNKEHLRSYIINNFSGETVADKYLKIYKESILNYL